MDNVINDFSIIVGTKNGSGSQTANNTILRAIFKMGIPVSGKNLFPSNIQGLPTWYTIRASKDGFLARREEQEVVIAMNPDSFARDLASVAPGGAFYYADDIKQPITRAELGMRPEASVFWCGQSLYKYLPQYDEVFPRIAKEAGDCQFVFIRHAGGEGVNELFQRRLERAFAAHGLNAADHCLFLSRLGAGQFVAAIGLCDVFLDSIGWSGCNSTLEALAFDLPIVSLPGALMRGRHTMAILRMIGVTETVADSIDGYVATAVRLGRDASWRAARSAQIAAHKHRVYRDRSCIAALGTFLQRVARGEGT